MAAINTSNIIQPVSVPVLQVEHAKVLAVGRRRKKLKERRRQYRRMSTADLQARARRLNPVKAQTMDADEIRQVFIDRCKKGIAEADGFLKDVDRLWRAGLLIPTGTAKGRRPDERRKQASG